MSCRDNSGVGTRVVKRVSAGVCQETIGLARTNKTSLSGCTVYASPGNVPPLPSFRGLGTFTGGVTFGREHSMQDAGDGGVFSTRVCSAPDVQWTEQRWHERLAARVRGVPRLSQAQRSCLGEFAQRPNAGLARRKAHLNFLNLCLTAAARARPCFENCVSQFPLASGPLPPSHPTRCRPPGHNSSSSSGLSTCHTLLLSENTPCMHCTPHHITSLCRL